SERRGRRAAVYRPGRRGRRARYLLAAHRRALPRLRRLPGQDEPEDPARRARAALGLGGGAALGGLVPADARKEGRERLELVVGVVGAEGAGDALDVEVARLAQLRVARVGEDSIGDTRVRIAGALA